MIEILYTESEGSAQMNGGAGNNSWFAVNCHDTKLQQK